MKLFGGDVIECRACHREISTAATFCPHCGESQKDFKLFGGSLTKCRACGREVSTDATECPYCNEDLTGVKLFGGSLVKCRACGREVSTDATECPYCNEDLTGIKLFGGNLVKCRACGREVSTDATECPYCNEDLTGIKLFGGNLTKCSACGMMISTDANVCPNCSEIQNSLFGSSARSSRISVSAHSRYNANNPYSSSGNEDSSDSGGWLIKLIFYGALIIGAIWLAFAVVLPLIIIDCALISLILGLIYKGGKTYWFSLSVAGVLFVFLDYNNGWITRKLIENVSFFEKPIPFLVYLNLAAGLIACYFLICDFLDQKSIIPGIKAEFSKRNLIVVGALLIVGASVVLLQNHFRSSRFLDANITYSNGGVSGSTPVSQVANNVVTSQAVSAASQGDSQSNAVNQGIYPQTSQRLLTANDLIGLDKKSLRIMRNEIFARHGYIFRTTEMKSYFENQAWYKPMYADVTNQLSEVENANVELIKSYERR